jgi:hypothetical protein
MWMKTLGVHHTQMNLAVDVRCQQHTLEIVLHHEECERMS